VSEDGPISRRTRRSVALRNLLFRTGIMDYKLLSSIIFKSRPPEHLMKRLQEAGYQMVELPRNSYSGE
jgi:hypothetical protein